MDYENFDWPEKSLISIFENLEFQTQITVLMHLLHLPIFILFPFLPIKKVF